ncbi:MAG: hypothetical protein KAF91_15680 [Nostoc sp. TH1S01]|nr:hypothetical protein [Nostoc sp. TH1S01]
MGRQCVAEVSSVVATVVGFPDLKRLPRRGAKKNFRGVVIAFAEVRSLHHFSGLLTP